MASHGILLPSLLFLVASSLATVTLSDDVNCVYSMYIRTGSIIKAGTNSVISVTLYDNHGYYVNISDLVAWGGAMEGGHDYFEWRNLDIFTGTAPCLKGAPCAINVTSDGSGSHHGWNCDYVEVTITGVHAGCSQQYFKINQWLALDTSPYRLWAVTDRCSAAEAAEGKETFAPRKALSSIVREMAEE